MFFRLLNRNHINAAPKAKPTSGPTTTPAIQVLLAGAGCATGAAVGERVEVVFGKRVDAVVEDCTDGCAVEEKNEAADDAEEIAAEGIVSTTLKWRLARPTA